MRWLRERLEWEDPKVRQSVAVIAFCLAILVILLLVPNGPSLLGAGRMGSGSDIALISDVRIDGLSVDDGDAGLVSDGGGENDLRKRFLEAGLLLDGDPSSLFADDADSPTQGFEDSRSDRTSEDTAEADFAGGSLGTSFDQFEGARAWARPSSGFGNGGFVISGVVGGAGGARATGESDGGAVRSIRDTDQLAHTTHALRVDNVDPSGADPSNGAGLAFLPDNAISGNDGSSVTAYPASGGSTIVSGASGSDPLSGPNSDALTPPGAADPAPVPEPSGLILIGSGLILLARRLRRWVPHTS